MRPAIGSLLLTARLEPGVQQVDAAFECGAIPPAA